MLWLWSWTWLMTWVDQCTRWSPEIPSHLSYSVLIWLCINMSQISMKIDGIIEAILWKASNDASYVLVRSMSFCQWSKPCLSGCGLIIYVLLRKCLDWIEGNIRLITCWSDCINHVKIRNSSVSLFVILLWHLKNYNTLRKPKCWVYILPTPPVNFDHPLTVPD